ncbi:hypothetical protein [Staphylococcus chromogenes]|uniref:hypothetical protein n=1 Tax=Staphylococcus chromogenes TaxID=46126 RepID=UPI003B00E9A7
MKDTNLLNETIEALSNNGLTFEDVLWIGCKDYAISIDEFKKLANVEYDSGYGAPKVATDLKIVGENWWLEREEYDGSEWWQFRSKPINPKRIKKINSLIVDERVSIGWSALSDINEEDK